MPVKHPNSLWNLKKKRVQVKTTALCQTKSPKHYRKRCKIQKLLHSPKSQSVSICFVFCGYFYVSLIWVAVLTIQKNISWRKLWNQYAHQVKCTMPKNYRIYFWYQKGYAYLFYKKNLASQVLRMMHGRHLFFRFLKTWVETREGRSTDSMWANPCHKKTHLNMSLERTRTKIYKPLTGPSLHSVGCINHNRTKMLVKGWIGLL